MFRITLIILSLVLVVATLATQAGPNPLVFREIIIPAPPEQVWEAWTTDRGLESFFAPRADVEPRPGGSFSVIFDPGAEDAVRGVEGMEILEFSAPEVLSFTWIAPPEFERARESGHLTRVRLELSAHGDGETLLRLVHSGIPGDRPWDGPRAYFADLWTIVLNRLAHRFETGPIDWNHPWVPPLTGIKPVD